MIGRHGFLFHGDLYELLWSQNWSRKYTPETVLIAGGHVLNDILFSVIVIKLMVGMVVC